MNNQHRTSRNQNTIRWLQVKNVGVLLLIVSIINLGGLVIEAEPVYAVSPGDIAIIGVRADDIDGMGNNGNDDAFAWVTLTNVAAGAEIFFTDAGWTAGNTFRGAEGAIKYTAPAGGLAAGTVMLVEFTQTSNNGYTFTPSGGGGTYTGADDANVGTASLQPATPGDNLFIFEGSTASPSFIWSWKNDGPYDADSTNNSTTALPAALTLGTNAMTIELTEDGTDNSRYVGPTSGSAAALAAAIADPANWEKVEAFPFPSGGNDITNGTLGSGGFTVGDVPTPTPTFTPTPIPPTPTPTFTPTPIPPTPTPTDTFTPTPIPPTPTPTFTPTPIPPTPTDTFTPTPIPPTPTDTFTPTPTPIPPTPTPTFTPTPANESPVAEDDAYIAFEDLALDVAAPGLLGNDTDAEGDPLMAILVSGPSNGLTVVYADGAFTYTPDPGFFGTDSFTYVANDGTSDSNVATVTIEVATFIGRCGGFDAFQVQSSGEYVSPNWTGDAIIVGTGSGETITGTELDDLILARGGSDTVNGLNGDDVICGGGGADTLNGNWGDDTLIGGGGADILDGSIGEDTLHGNGGNDTLSGGFGDDVLDGGNDTDSCNGGFFFDNDTVVNCEVMAAEGAGDESDEASEQVEKIFLPQINR